MTEPDDTAPPGVEPQPATAVDAVGLALTRPIRATDQADAVDRIQVALRAAIDR